MNKKIIIYSLLALTVLGLLGFWIYILMFGTPEVIKRFADLGGVGEPNEFVPPPIINPNLNNDDTTVTRNRLRQLTTKPVIGHREYTDDFGQPFVLYSEAGTGHIYRLDIFTGQESRLSGTTINRVAGASFSPTLGRVVFRTGRDQRRGDLLIGNVPFSEGVMETSRLDSGVTHFSFLAEGGVAYTKATNRGTTALYFDPSVATTTTLFNVPFFDTEVVWGPASSSRHFIYPRPSAFLEAALYSVVGGRLNRELVSGFGLTATGNDNYVIYSRTTRSGNTSFIHSRNLADSTAGDWDIGFGSPTSKCVFGVTSSSTLWCGFSIEAPTETGLPDSWYSGETTLTDNLWKMDLETEAYELVVNLLDESGRVIDIREVKLNQLENRLYFINKNDLTLWLYEL